MSWAESLVKLSAYEVEVLQKRLAEIVERRERADLRRALMEIEGETETQRAREDPAAGWQLAGFMEGLRLRKAQADAEIARLDLEERGARDALAEAFEGQKKYEHIAENARTAQRREAARRETAVLDELGLRRAVGAR